MKTNDSGDACAKRSVNTGRRSVMKLHIHGCLRNETLIKLPVRLTAHHRVDDAMDFISDITLQMTEVCPPHSDE